MNERLQELLDAVQRTASQVGGSAADAAYGMGKRAGELLSVAKLNIRIMDLKGAVSTALREVGEMIYATHTGTLTESEVLLAKLQEIDGLRQQIDRLEREIARLQGGAVCPFCGAAARSGDVFCRVPSPVDPPPGCRFAGRCPYATDRCRAEKPELCDMGSGHRVACHLCR